MNTGLDLTKWAIVAHKDDSCFGRMAEDIRAVLGIGVHLVIPSERLWDKPLDPAVNEILLDPKTPKEKGRVILKGLQGIIVIERHSWHPDLLALAKESGVKVVCVPIWEWFKGKDKEWRYCDIFICPNEQALRIVRKYGYDNSAYLPWTIDIARFKKRTVEGPARLFFHNAGLVNPDDRKATRDVIKAFKMVDKQDIRLTVRMQKEADMPELDARINVEVGNLENPAALYRTGDVAIQPSKLEGLGFMILEPLISGIPTITTDHPPMNEYVRQKEMLVRTKWFKHKAFPSSWVKHAYLKLPDTADLARKIAWCAEHDLAAISAANRAWADEVFDPDNIKMKWQDAIKDALY